MWIMWKHPAEVVRNWGNMKRASFKCNNCGNYSGLKRIYKSKEKEDRGQATANWVLKLEIKTWY